MSFKNEAGRLPSIRDIAKEYPVLYLRYSRKLQDLIRHLNPEPVLEGADSVLRPWQESLHQCLLGAPPDDRAILFYVDEEGGQGKTFFQRFMVSNYPEEVQILSVGKRDDIAHALDDTKRIFLFNIPRGGMEYFNYTSIEQIKDRMIFSPKYDSRTKILTTNPHVVVFCN